MHFNLPEDVEKKEKEREERDKLAWDYGDRLKPRRSLNGTGIGEVRIGQLSQSSHLRYKYSCIPIHNPAKH